jgi:hypothetical protein
MRVGRQIETTAGTALAAQPIERALMLDYNDFSISGELKTLEIKDSKPCP